MTKKEEDYKKLCKRWETHFGAEPFPRALAEMKRRVEAADEAARAARRESDAKASAVLREAEDKRKAEARAAYERQQDEMAERYRERQAHEAPIVAAAAEKRRQELAALPALDPDLLSDRERFVLRKGRTAEAFGDASDAFARHLDRGSSKAPPSTTPSREAMQAAEQALADFDAAHPEIREGLAARERLKDPRD